ncbi:hypothetical protein HA402_000192 [Bradysia odoriphaga]|nr:hypothetical protein HA402_000192 [Bradysia odoriphaga]
MATNTASAENFGENHFFYEDEVLKFDKNGRVKFGLVLESYEANYSESESDFEDSVKKGEIRVAWHPQGSVEVIEEQYIGLADRTLMPGNVVRRIGPGKDTQKGYCRHVFVSADVRIKGTTFVLKNISSDRLRPIDTFIEDDVVCLDSWVGSTKRIEEKLVLKTSCGALVEVRPSDRHFFKLRDPDSKHKNGYFHHTLFHPGQTLIGSIQSLENEQWLTPKPDRQHRRTKFTVESVEIEGVRVYWQCKASDNVESKSDYKASQPNAYVTGNDLKRLKRLNLFESSMLQINDMQYLKIEEKDLVNLTSKSQWRKERNDNYKILHNQKTTENQQKIKIVESLPLEEKSLKFDGDKKINFSPKLKLCSLTVHNGRCNNCDMFEANAKKHFEAAIKKKRQFDDMHLNAAADDDEDGWTDQDEDDDSCSDVTTASSRGSTPTPRSSPKRSPLLSKKDKKLKKRSNNKSNSNPPKVGDDIVTEAIVVYSQATVVWQDGTIESGISSRHLYPIHHLDEHEFFPGDFVLSGSESNDLAYRNYGVIQSVDHNGRTAMVKWFRTYTMSDTESRPQFLNEAEASVYDLKDHPDFQFRPGMIVLRVANFERDESKCTDGKINDYVGQVIDNYAEGRVKVWWVDGHVSMCWPQDLFEVGQPEDSFWIGESENSDEWETESETSEPGSQTDTQLRPQLSYNLERARIAMAHLEEMFKLNPKLENDGVVRKLLEVYKKCRFIDRLMNTTFFHTDNFNGLLERVRHGSSSASTTTAARVLDHKNRLFGSDETNVVKSPTKSIKPTLRKLYGMVRIEVDVAEQSAWRKQSQEMKSLDETTVSSLNSSSDTKNCSFDTFSLSESTSIPHKDCTARELNDSNHLTVSHQDLNRSHDSGNHSKTEWGEGSRCSSSDLTDNKPTDDQTSNSCCSIDFGSDELPESVCARLCALMKVQLFKALQEINKRVNTNPTDSVKIEESYVINDATIDAADVSSELGPYDDCNCTVTEDVPTVADNVDIETNYSVINPVPSECFVVLENAPTSHKFNLTVCHPSSPQFSRAIRFDHKLLRTSLPAGVWVKTYGDRLDLLSVMIEGPTKTPYEDGLFLFDFQLGKDYPRAPPLCHYVSFCSDRLNPNLYEDGKVCVSLLGTWHGKGSEMWSASSTLLQVIVSIQGLILVSEPYYNEAGYEKQRGTQQGIENSRMYNEMVVLKLVESMTKVIANPPEVFRDEIIKHFRERGEKMCNRIKNWMDMSTTATVSTNAQQPDFSLVPASRGFCLKLVGLLENFRNKLEAMNQLLLPP